MDKYTVVLLLPDAIQDDESEPTCYLGYAEADTTERAIALVQEEACKLYQEIGYELEPNDFAALVTFANYIPPLQFGSFA